MSADETMTLVARSGEIQLPAEVLLVALDDTGHENFAPGHRTFGLGGCACLVKDYGRLVDIPWRGMKEELFGGQNVRLHAAELKAPSQPQLEGVEYFFANFQFFRFAVMVSDTINNETEHGLIKVVSRMALDRIARIAGYARPSGVTIIFESSARTEGEILSELSSYRMGNGEVDFQPHAYALPKAAGWPMLEVADFIMHAAGGQVRAMLSNKFIVRKDFKAVFHSVDQRLSDYTELLGLRNSPNAV